MVDNSVAGTLIVGSYPITSVITFCALIRMLNPVQELVFSNMSYTRAKTCSQCCTCMRCCQIRWYDCRWTVPFPNNVYWQLHIRCLYCALILRGGSCDWFRWHTWWGCWLNNDTVDTMWGSCHVGLPLACQYYQKQALRRRMDVRTWEGGRVSNSTLFSFSIQCCVL